MGSYLQDRLDEAFPSSADLQLLRAVQQGILISDAVLESESWLRGALGRDVRGHLRRAGILSRVHDACTAGDLPFLATIAHMPRGPFHWVELSSGGYKAHVCRTDSPSAFPEDTPTRQDERLTNERSLFENVVSLKEAAETATDLFAWLTFGAPADGQISHLCWAMPAADGKSWLAHSNVLYRLATSQLRAEPEAPPERAKIKFKEQIAEAMNKPDETARVED